MFWFASGYVSTAQLIIEATGSPSQSNHICLSRPSRESLPAQGRLALGQDLAIWVATDGKFHWRMLYECYPAQQCGSPCTAPWAIFPGRAVSILNKSSYSEELNSPSVDSCSGTWSVVTWQEPASFSFSFLCKLAELSEFWFLCL